MAERLFLPDVQWPKPDPGTGGVAPRQAIFRASEASEPSRQQVLRFAPIGSSIRVILGEYRVAAIVPYILPYASYAYAPLLWCWDGAGNEGLQSIEMNDSAVDPGSGVSFVHYDGTSNPIDPWLTDVWASKGETYTDTLAGWCYSVAKIPQHFVANSGMPNFTAIVRGVKAYDDRTGTTAWTDNPSLLTARFIEDADWGMGDTVYRFSTRACADANDDLVAGDKRRRIGMAIDGETSVEDMLDTLRTYAGCWVLRGENGATFVPDRPLGSFTAIGDGTAYPLREVSETVKRSRQSAPTLLRLWYTDTSTKPWGRDYVEIKHPSLDSGGVPRRESDVRLWGIKSRAQAVREGTERINKLTLADLSVRYGLFEEGADFSPGDGVALTSAAAALTSKQLRVFETNSRGTGDWDFVGVEYDAAAYSDAVESDPSTPDTSFADPNDPQPPSGLALVEEQYVRDDGETETRIYATWSAPATFPWVAEYIVEVREPGGGMAWSGRTRADAPEFRTGPLREGLTYQVDVFTVSSSRYISTATSETLTSLGDQLDPGNVPTLTGVAARGEVHLAVGAAIDKNMAGYVLRYVAVAGSWDAGTEFAVEGARSGFGAYVRSRLVPSGTWDILARAYDTRDRLSPTPARLTLTVPPSDDSSLLESALFTAPTLTLMSMYREVPWGPRKWVSDAGDSFAFGHADTNDATGTFSDLASTPFAVPRSGGDSVWLSEIIDLGVEVAGDFKISGTVTDLSGTHTLTLKTSTDNISYTDHTGGTAKVSARYVRAEIRTAGVMVVSDDIRFDVIAEAQEESHSFTSSTSAGTTVTLNNQYTKLVDITLAIEGASANRTWSYQTVLDGSGLIAQITFYVMNASTGALTADNCLAKVRAI